MPNLEHLIIRKSKMQIEIKGWSNIDDCQYPVCEKDGAVPVWILWKGNEIEAWYRNPKMNECWFESDTGAVLEGSFWKEREDLN